MRRLQHSMRPVVVLLGAMLILGGCVENRASVTIKHMAVPNSDCTVSAADEEFISLGVLDVGAMARSLPGGSKYWAFPVVQNNMVATKDELGTNAELNWVEIIEARIDLDFGQLSDTFEPVKFSFPTFKTLAPGDSAPLGVVIIPPQIASLLASVVEGTDDQPMVRVKLKFLYEHGEYEHETHQIEFPVVICDGCRVYSVGDCPGGSQLVGSDYSTGVCNAAQDGLACCVDTNTSTYVCPPVDTTTEQP